MWVQISGWFKSLFRLYKLNSGLVSPLKPLLALPDIYELLRAHIYPLISQNMDLGCLMIFTFTEFWKNSVHQMTDHKTKSVKLIIGTSFTCNLHILWWISIFAMLTFVSSLRLLGSGTLSASYYPTYQASANLLFAVYSDLSLLFASWFNLLVIAFL